MAKTAAVIAGLEPTGRRIPGPAYDLVEGTAQNGLKHLTMVYQPAYVGHPALTGDLQAALGFMEHPELAGVVRLASYVPETGAFAYPTGTVWPVSEVVRTFADLGAGAGVKAGLELAYLVAELLTEAEEPARQQGLESHGNVNPWTLVLKADGQPQIIGYGLPQVDLLALKQGGSVPSEDAFRYAPPERLEGAEEDLSSDLFSLALVALELMMGRPVYDGLVDDIRQQASRGEGMRRLYQWRERIPDNVREVLGRALKPDPDTRYRHGADFVYELHDLLGSLDVEGPSLVEAMAKVRALQRRGKAAAPGESGALSTDELREIAADLEVFDEVALPPPRVGRAPDDKDAGAETPRWTRARRRDDAESEEGQLSARERLKRRLRTGGGKSDPGASDGSARRRLKQRLGQSRGSPPQPDPPAAERGAARDRLRRRLRKSAGAKASPPAPATGDVPSPPTGELPELDLDPDTGQVDEQAVARVDEQEATGAPELAASEASAPEPEPTTAIEADPTEMTGGSAAALLRQSAAAELLEKLRTSGGRSRRRRSGRARASASGGASPPVETPPESPAAESPAAERPAPPGRSSRRRVPEKSAEAAPAAPSADAPSTPEPTPKAGPAKGTSAKSAAAKGASAKSASAKRPSARGRAAKKAKGPTTDDAATITVALADPELSLVVPSDTRAATLVRLATSDRGRLPVDLSGRMTGWWRLSVGGIVVPGDREVRALDGKLALVWVPNQPQLMAVEVQGRGDAVRFQSLVGVAVPARWLLDHLRQWLSLPDGSWRLRVDDVVLDPDRILDEVVHEGSVLVVEPA